MEIKNRNKKKKETLAGIFRKYMAFFCASSAVLLLFSLSLIMTPFLYDGFLLPANYVEHRVQELLPELEKKEKITASDLPSSCTYAVYDEKGIFLYGDLDSRERKTVWRSYEQLNKYAADGGFYNFAVLKNGDICVIKYWVKVRYSLERLNDVLPPPEVLPFLIFLVLFFLDGYLLSRRFGGRMERELRSLGEATEKISREDLEFQTESSDIREIDRVLDSLEALKNALKKSLEEQWDAEQTKNRQLSALAHDIKTPLTVVRGNAELLTESDLTEADQACARAILENAGQMERYLDSMRQVLKGQRETRKLEELPAEEMTADFCQLVRQMAAGRGVPVTFDIQTEKSGETKEHSMAAEEQDAEWQSLETSQTRSGSIAVEDQAEVIGNESDEKCTEHCERAERQSLEANRMGNVSITAEDQVAEQRSLETKQVRSIQITAKGQAAVVENEVGEKYINRSERADHQSLKTNQTGSVPIIAEQQSTEQQSTEHQGDETQEPYKQETGTNTGTSDTEKNGRKNKKGGDGSENGNGRAPAPTIPCCKEEILRAWGNLVSNALEHTDPKRGIHVTIKIKQAADPRTSAIQPPHFFCASIRDYGKGFSSQELLHATEPFYSGDESRHDHSHQGLGLSIARRFAEEQGGFLEYGNAQDGAGAEVFLWLRMD